MNHMLEAEEKALKEFLKWSGGTEDDANEKKKNKIQACVLAIRLLLASGVVFYFNRINLYQFLGPVLALLGGVFLFVATVINISSSNIKFTDKYIDTESIRKRLEEIKLNKSNQQGPSSWTR
jgi:hypothetical protein